MTIINRGSRLNTGPFFWLMASVFAVALGYGVALPMLPLMNRAPFWGTAGLLLIGAAASARAPLSSAQPATKPEARF
jgi:hypothetical protein